MPGWRGAVQRAVRAAASVRDHFARSPWLVVGPLAYFLQLTLEVPYRIHFVLDHYQRTDFISFYAGGVLAGRDLSTIYSVPGQLAVERSIDPSIPGVLLFPNPPLAAVALRPLVGLPFSQALPLWLGLCGVALFLAGCLLYRLLPPEVPRYQRLIAVGLATGYAAVENLGVGQWGSLQLLAVAASLAIARSGRTVTAGAVLALVLVKPQAGLLIAPALLLGRHRRLLAGFLLGCGAWAISTLLLIGPAGIGAWLTVLGQLNRDLNSAYDGLPALAAIPFTLAGSPHAAGAATATAIILAIAAVAGMYRLRGWLAGSPERAISAGLVTSFVCALAVHNWDASLLAVPLLLALRADRAGGTLIALAVGMSTLVPHLTSLVVAAWLLAAAAMVWKPALRPRLARV